MNDRSIHKTIRISNQIYEYIDSFVGTTWNDKVNNMVDHVLNFEKQRQQTIENLDKQIEERKKRLNDLDKVVQDAKQALGVNRYW